MVTYTGAGYGIESGMMQILIVLLTIYAVIAKRRCIKSLCITDIYPADQTDQRHMTSFDGNDFTYHSDPYGYRTDKIGHAYNEMLKNIEEFQNEVKNQQKELRISEMNTLISQINPAFSL